MKSFNGYYIVEWFDAQAVMSVDANELLKNINNLPVQVTTGKIIRYTETEMIIVTTECDSDKDLTVIPSCLIKSIKRLKITSSIKKIKVKK